MTLNIKTIETPRFVIKELYKLDLPIKGGWGYSIDDACIIDKTDKSVIQGIPFDGVSVEYAFIEKRNYAELINTHYSKEIFRKTELCEKLNNYTEENNIWHPTEGNFDVFSKIGIYKTFKMFDKNEILIVDEFYENKNTIYLNQLTVILSLQ